MELPGVCCCDRQIWQRMHLLRRCYRCDRDVLQVEVEVAGEQQDHQDDEDDGGW